MERQVFFLCWLGKHRYIESSRVDCLDLEIFLKENVDENIKEKHTMVSFSIDLELAKDRL